MPSEQEQSVEKIRAAIKTTEYKYFGDYEMSDDQRDAVDVLVAAAEKLISNQMDGDKALMPEAAVGEPVAYYYSRREYGKLVSYAFEHAESRRSELRDGEREIALYAHPITTPTPVEEPANAATNAGQVEAALRPFADCCDYIGADESDEEWAKFRLLVKDYRRARDTLAALTNGQATGESN